MVIKRILVIAHDPNLLTFLRLGLEREGLAVYTALIGRDGMRLTYELHPHLILLDLDSLLEPTLYQRLRHLCDTPIMMLTARSDFHPPFREFLAERDSILEKPFNLDLLKGRIHTLLEQVPNLEDNQVVVYDDGHLEINLEEQSVKRGGELVSLTPTETRLLFYLVGQRGRIVPHRELLTSVWGPEYTDELGYLSVYIRYIRRKIERDPNNPSYVRTRWGVGYYFSNNGRT